MAKNIYGHPLADDYGADYDSYHSHHLHGLPNEPVADETTDQLPLFSQVGRGISGDSYKVEISSDSDNATYLVGSRFDAALKQWIAEWESENINGGHLDYSYQFYDDIITPAFTITFTYTRPGRIEWEWTTPLIPYIPEDTEHIITVDKLSSILSVPKSQLQWLIDNKEADEGDENDTGIHNTEKDLLDWIDDNDKDLGNAINSETIARQDADAGLNTAIENEATTRKNADDNLQTAIDNEATTRKNADDGLQTAIDNEATTRKSADDTLQKNIDAIKQCECDEEALKQEILDHLHNDLGFDTDSFLSDGKGKTVKQYIDDLIGTGLITKADVDEWIQEWLEGHPTEFIEIFQEINENHQVTYYNDSPDDNDLKAWWVLARSDLLNLSMFKISCEDEDPTFKVDGKDNVLISGIPYDVIPAYGSIWPISYGEYWDNEASTMRPCTLFIGILGKNNVAEGAKGSLFYRCDPSDGNYGGSDYVSGPMRVHNTVLYFNDYVKVEGEGSLPLNTSNPLVAR